MDFKRVENLMFINKFWTVLEPFELRRAVARSLPIFSVSFPYASASDIELGR